MSSNHLNCSSPRCLVIRKNARLCDVLGIWQAALSHTGQQGLVVCALHLHDIAACQTMLSLTAVKEMVPVTPHMGSQVRCYLSLCPMQPPCAFELKLQHCVVDHPELTA